MKIGIIPNSNNFSRPSDRRKIIRYLQIKNLSFEKATFLKEYDILYLSGKTDLTKWLKYKDKNKFYNTKVIFDASDPYLSDPIFYNIIRSFYYFIIRKNKYFYFNYASQFKKMIREADVVICASEEQKKEIIHLNKNVQIIRDYFDVDIKNRINARNKKIKKELNIFWEGQSHANISIFRMVKNILSKITKYKINLHIVTDRKYCYLGGLYFCLPTINILNNIFKDSNIKIYFYDWNIENLLIASKKCEIGIIPVPNKKRMQLKPENKLILMWILGLPVLTSKTESYARTMNEIGQDWACKNLDDWTKKMYKLIESEKEMESYVDSINKFFDNNYTSSVLTNKWDNFILK